MDPHDDSPFGTKCLVVATGGHIDMHGQVGETWTTLQTTALANDTSITLTTSPGWKVGDEIIIASTDFGPMYKYDKAKGSISWAGASRDLEEQSEKRKIKSISGNIITFDEPLKYNHWVNEYYSAEVGSLTRRIVIQGDESSDDTLFGGHFLVRYANTRVTGVEFTRMGQLGVLGRYPVHFHMAGDVRDIDAYIKDCSIHDNYQRCLVVHDTHGTLIENNVAYKTNGHCYFLEDAGERMNVFHRNLGIHAIPVPDELELQKLIISDKITYNIQLIPTDNSPSIFWITNPNNTFTDNVAVGGRLGFWFLPPLRVRFPSSLNYGENDEIVRPRSSPLKLFKGNIAHSCSDTGLEIDEYLKEDDTTESGGYWVARQGPFDPTSEDVSKYPILEIKFENFTAYKCRSFGVWGKSSMRFTGMRLFDNRFGLMVNGETMVEDSLFVGETDNPGNPWQQGTDRQYPSPWGDSSLPIIGHQTYDNGGPQYSRNNVFLNYKSNDIRKAGALGPLENGPYLLNTENRVYNLEFDDSDRVYVDLRANDGPYGFNIMDIDGSVTDLNVPAWIINRYAPHSINDKCIEKQSQNVYYCPARRGGFVQLRITDRTGSYKLDFDYSSKKGPTDRDVSARVYRLSDGEFTYVRGGSVSCDGGRCHRWTQNFETYNIYSIEFVDRNGNKINTPKVIRAEMDSSSRGDWVIMAIPYPKHSNLKVNRVQWDNKFIKTLSSSDNLCELSRDNYYYDKNLELLFLFFDNIGAYNGDYTNRFGLLDPNNETPYYIVEAVGCGANGCTPTNSKLPIGLNITNEVYSTDLVYCNTGNVVGNAYFTFDPREMKASYTVNFINPYNYNDISLYYEDSTKVEQKIKTKAFPGPTSPLRGDFILSHQQWTWLYNGKIHIRVTGNDVDDICGRFTCENECIEPKTKSSSDPCEKPEGTITIFGDQLHVDYSISGWGYSDETPFDYQITSEEAICGEKSILLKHGALMLGGWSKPVSVNLNKFSHLEFYTMLVEGETVLEVQVKLDNSDSLVSNVKVGIEYVDNFIVDSNTWARVSIPLEKFKVTATNKSVTYISFFINEFWNRPHVQIYLDEVRFVKKEKDSTIKEIREQYMERCLNNIDEYDDDDDTSSHRKQLTISFLVLLISLFIMLQ